MFEKIYCINLNHRTERWEESEKEFKRIGWEVERFGTTTDFNNSQYRCLQEAKQYNSSLILEDDVCFGSLNHLDNSYSELPEDWDIISLGANLREEHTERIGGNLYRYTNGWTTHAMGYSKKMVEWILENFNPEKDIVYDEWLRINVLPFFNCYIVYPMVAFQRPSYSDLMGMFADYTEIFETSKSMFK